MSGGYVMAVYNFKGQGVAVGGPTVGGGAPAYALPAIANPESGDHKTPVSIFNAADGDSGGSKRAQPQTAGTTGARTERANQT